MIKTYAIGRLGSAPEMRHTQAGIPVTTFSLAVRSGKDQTTWLRCSAWRKQAEVAAQYLSKGSQVFVEGIVKARAWQGKDGDVRSELDLNVVNFQMIGERVSAQDTAPLEGFSGTPTPMFADSDIPF